MKQKKRERKKREIMTKGTLYFFSIPKTEASDQKKRELKRRAKL
jgi:hypothetical protein